MLQKGQRIEKMITYSPTFKVQLAEVRSLKKNKLHYFIKYIFTEFLNFNRVTKKITQLLCTLSQNVLSCVKWSQTRECFVG